MANYISGIKPTKLQSYFALCKSIYMLHESGTVRLPGDNCFHVHVCDVDSKSLPSFVLIFSPAEYQRERELRKKWETSVTVWRQLVLEKTVNHFK